MSGAIFAALLGDTFDELPGPLQELHRGERSSVWQGEASVRGAQRETFEVPVIGLIAAYRGLLRQPPVYVRIAGAR